MACGTTASAAWAQRAPTPVGPADGRREPRLKLDDVLQRAITQSPLIEAARHRAAAARGVRRTAGTLSNPLVTYWVENVGSRGGTGTPADRETQLYATLPLEPLFQRAPRVRGAEATVRAADAELARARQLVALDAARAFYRVAAAQQSLAASLEIQGRLGELVTFSRARVREGVAAEADLIRVQLELDRVAAGSTLEQVELFRAHAALAPYLGGVSMEPVVSGAGSGVPGVPFEVLVDDGPSVTQQDTLAPVTTYITRAMASRPDLVASRSRADAARADISYQRALSVRQVGATLGTKRTAGITTLLAGVSLPVPLFDQNRGEVQRATANERAASLELAWAELQAAAEVRAAYEAARLLTREATRLRVSFLARAEQSRDIALAAYREGAVSLLQVLDASRTLADARLAYYRTSFAQQQSLLDLHAAAGGLPLERSSAPPAMDIPRRDAPPISLRPSGDRT